MNNNVSRKEEKEYKKVDPGILASSGAFGGRRTKLKKSSKKSKKNKKTKKIRKIRTTQRR
jgi:hypothetical protein